MDVGLTAYGSGFIVNGCRAEDCNFGYLIGVDTADTDQGASGFAMDSSTEGCDVGVYFKGTCTGFAFGGGAIGHDFAGYFSGRHSQKGFWIGDKCSYGVLTLIGSQWFDVAGVYIETASSRTNMTYNNCDSTIGAGTGVPYVIPTNAYTATFNGCNIVPIPIWTYSELPTGGNVAEGDLFNISDGNGTGLWGANVTAGSGSNARLVRWNGSNWTVVAQ